MAEIPAAPLTLEGAMVLHQMFRLRREKLRSISSASRDSMLDQAIHTLSDMEQRSVNGRSAQSALYSLVGHKGDLLLLHFRESLEALHEAELQIAQLGLYDFLEPVYSYLSVVELGLYDSSTKLYGQLVQKGIEPYSDSWNAEIRALLERQASAMAPRLWPEIPPTRYLCFYPMDRKRGEKKNWYLEPIAERQRMMHEHGLIGRRYANCVKQIITGSIGLDDWEWGVDLFADDPLIFKKLIYEMRFDEVSAIYALFGSFYVGLRVRAMELENLLLAGKLQA
jgi:peroxiredoxin